MRYYFLPTLIFLLGSNPAFAQTYLGNLTSYSSAGNTITVNADTSSLKFIFYKPDIVRIDFHPSPSTQIDSSFVVIRDTSEVVSYSINDLSDRIEISTSSLIIICLKNPVRISIQNSSGKVLLKEPGEGGISSDGNERTVNFEIHPNDHFYGTGERGTSLDKRGQSFYSYNTQNYGYSSPLETMNTNVPFVANSNGYGIYFDNTYPAWFDLGDINPNRFSYKVSGGEMSYYFIASETLPEQIEKYTWLTGRQPLPPKWALGYIQSKFGYRNEAEARTMVQTMRQKEIPCDAIILDLYWFEHMGDISWNLANFPQPFQMMNDFLNDGIKTIAITEPYVVQYSSNFNEAFSNNYFAFNSSHIPVLIPNWWSCGCNAGLLDLTNPVVQDWWWDKHPQFFGDELAGIWSDLGEPENHPETMNHFLGSRNKVHNIYNFIWSQVLFDGINEIRPNKRVFNLTRSGFAGSQRFGVIPWSGDVAREFSGLEVQLPMLLNMGISGFGYHNSDIGGFCCGNTTPELYARWMQYGAFSPITRAHGHDSQPTEPWGFGTSTEAIAKEFISLRYQLLPYIYTLAYENFSSGMPLIRPLFFYYLEDANLNNYSDAYLLGESVLISPVVNEGVTNKNVYLPEGEWVDYYTDQILTGGNHIVNAPLNQMPLFIRRGSIIPMQPLMNYTDEFPLDTLILSVYPSPVKDAGFTLYEDDGETLEYQNGSHALTDLSQSFISSNDIMLNIGSSIGNYNGKLSDRIYLSDIHHISLAPSEVFNNNIAIAERSSYQDLRNNLNGYFYDDILDRLYIQIKGNTDSTYEIRASGIVLSAEELAGVFPDEFILEQNYPNPFNPVTKINWETPLSSQQSLIVYDILGNEVVTLLDEYRSAGRYEVDFDASFLSSGIYFYTLKSGNFIKTKKMILLK